MHSIYANTDTVRMSEIIDNEWFDRFCRDLGDASYEMIELFIKQLPSDRKLVEEAYSAQSMEGLEEACHPLKGGSGIFGAVAVSELSEKYATMALNKHWPDSTQMDEYFNEMDKLLVCLEGKLKSI